MKHDVTSFPLQDKILLPNSLAKVKMIFVVITILFNQYIYPISILSQNLLYRKRHSGLDPESSPFNWIPAGVYPVLDTGRE